MRCGPAGMQYEVCGIYVSSLSVLDMCPYAAKSHFLLYRAQSYPGRRGEQKRSTDPPCRAARQRKSAGSSDSPAFRAPPER